MCVRVFAAGTSGRCGRVRGSVLTQNNYRLIAEQSRSSYGMGSRTSASTTLLVTAALATMATMANGLCPARCRCDDEYLRASCASAGLDVVPIQLNPDIRHLDLSGNRVASLRLTFDFYGNLESLDLDSNLIHTLGSDNFAMQQRLLTLNVSQNAIRAISKTALRGLGALRELDLSGNNITEIDEQAFRHTGGLEFLDLSRNSLTSLPDGLLTSLHKIRTLILGKNSLLEAPANNLALAPSLEHLDLSDNLIQELNRDSLSALPTLATLNLANNVIRSLADDAFDRLPGLLHLDLSGNNLTSVPTAALSKLSMLSSMMLSRNPLGILHNVAFRNLFELRSLELEECAIIEVHARAFADNVNLEHVSLDGNRDLTELPSRVLYGARYLKWLSLRHCNLATLQPTHFPVDGLAHLGVGGNPLVCNCSVHWLWNVIRSEVERRNESRLKVDSREIVCADEEFAGKALIALPESSLRCHLSALHLALFATGCLTATSIILALIVYATRARRRKSGEPTYAPTRPELLVYVGRNDDVNGKNSESYGRRLITQLDEVRYRSTPTTPTTPAPASLPVNKELPNLYETPHHARYPYRRDEEDGVYAVADEAPEVLSLYHMQNPPRSTRPSFPPGLNDYDYEAPFQCQQKQRPHVVFV